MKTHPREMDVEQGSVVSPKLDGVFVRATRDGAFTKSGKRVSLPKLERRLRPFFAVHRGADLRGEMYRHGKSFEGVVSAFRHGGKGLRYHVFPGGPRPVPVFGVRHINGRRVRSPEQADRLYRKWLRRGYEGQVIQSPRGEVSKRKPEEDAEFEVVGGRRAKRHGVLTVRDGRGRTFRVAAPVSAIGARGKMATIRYRGRTSGGLPRGASFKAIRDYEMAAVAGRQLVSLLR